MSFSEQLWFAWPWIGLGMAMLMLVLLLCTDFLHDASGSRWRDVSWYAWLPMPAYLFHQFEEYACHITNGQFDIVAQFYVPGNMPFSTDGLPLLHFPLVNIGLAWFGAPLAAMLCRRNPVIGCSYFGFMFLNGMTHIVMGGSPAENPGLTTGAFLFVPSALWMLYMTSKEHIFSPKEAVISFSSGLLAHGCLFIVYMMSSVGVGAIYIGDVVCSFSPILWAWIGCKAFGVRKADVQEVIGG